MDANLGPVEVFISLPAIVAAIVVAVSTTGVKAVIDTASGGTDKRKLNPWLSKVVLPAVPLALGALYGAFVPFRPEYLVEYVAAHPDAPMVIVGAAYGVVVGQFSDYIYTRITKTMKAFSEAGERKRASRPPEEVS